MDFNLAQVNIDHILTVPDAGAPVFIQEMLKSPGDTLENGPVTLEFRFSKPMETAEYPEVSIGQAQPFDDLMLANGSWSEGNQTYTTTVSDLGNLESNVDLGIRIAGAKGVGDRYPIPQTLIKRAFYINRSASAARHLIDLLPILCASKK